MRGRRVVPVLFALSFAGSCSEGSVSEDSGYLRCPDGPREQVTSVDGPPQGYDSYRETAAAVLGAPISDETEFVVSGEYGGHRLRPRARPDRADDANGWRARRKLVRRRIRPLQGLKADASTGVPSEGDQAAGCSSFLIPVATTSVRLRAPAPLR